MEKKLDYGKMGERIRVRRGQLGFSQEWLAELVDISVTHLSRIENGKTNVSLQVFAAIAEALGFTFDELVFGTPEAVHDATLQRIIQTAEKMNAAELAAYEQMGRTICENNPYRA